MNKLLLRFSIFVMLVTATIPSHAQNIITVCGNGLAGYYGDGIAATLSQMYQPSGIAVDASGSILFCDAGNNCVRKITPTGIITKIAGTGVSGYTGDGSAATSATFNRPSCVAIDNSGNIYIGDAGNSVIRSINTSGIITTAVGTGTAGYSGDGSNATLAQIANIGGICTDVSGNLYVSDMYNGVVRKINTLGIISTYVGDPTVSGTYNGDNIPATTAALNNPVDLKVNSSGNLLIADEYNDRVRLVDGSGIIHTIYADSMVTFMLAPVSLAVDNSGNILIVDGVNLDKVFLMSPSGLIVPLAGNGTPGFAGDGSQATAAEIYFPMGISLDATGNVYFADNGNNRIRKVNTSGIISTIAGGATTGYGDGGTALNAELTTPVWTVKDAAGNLYISDAISNLIRKVNTSGTISTFAGTGTSGYSGDGGPATAAQIYEPYSMDFDGFGNLFYCDIGANIIRKINSSGIISTAVGIPSLTGGSYSGDGGPATACTLYEPLNLKIDRHNRIFICDRSNRRIRMVDTTGIITTIAGTGTSGYTGDGGPATAAEIASPHGITFDNSGNLYFCDASRCVVRKINTSGIISTIAGSGTWGYSGDGGPATNAQLAFPSALTIDSAGNIYVSDGSNSCIRKIDATGNINTVIGTGVAGFSGDGGLASAAKLNLSYGINLDNAGNMYIADWGNHRIRKVIYDLSVMPVDVLGEALSIYPNPNQGQFSVILHSQTDEEVNMTITDISGKTWVTQKLKTNTVSNISIDLPDGIYIFNTSMNGNRVSKKIIVMK